MLLWLFRHLTNYTSSRYNAKSNEISIPIIGDPLENHNILIRVRDNDLKRVWQTHPTSLCPPGFRNSIANYKLKGVVKWFLFLSNDVQDQNNRISYTFQVSFIFIYLFPRLSQSLAIVISNTLLCEDQIALENESSFTFCLNQNYKTWH